MKAEIDKRFTQIKFKSSYEHGCSLDDKSIAELNLRTKVQAAARILLEAIHRARRIKEANKSMISFTQTEMPFPVIKNFKVMQAAKLLLESISKNREARECIKAAEKHNKAFGDAMSSHGDYIARFVEKFIKSDTHEIAVGKAIRVSKLARAARCLLKEKYDNTD